MSFRATPKTISLAPRSVPLDDRWDVIVVGGGPAGCAAAIASAREGARTLLVESSGALGGAGTTALVPAWCPFSDKEKVIYRGIAEKVFRAAKEGLAHVKEKDLDWVPIDAERLKRVYDHLVTSSGAEILFHTVLSDVVLAGGGDPADGVVSHLVVSNKAGLSALRAKVYVDCTGDADLAAWAGAEFQQGDRDGTVQPATHCFILANVDEEAYFSGPGLFATNKESPIHAILKSGRYPLIPDTHLCQNLIGPGTVGFNAGHLWNVDSTDPASVSRALVLGRKMAASYRDALAEFAPAAFGNAHLVTTGAAVGIRESRRIVGDYCLTLDDYAARRSFDDEICRNCYFIDLHFTREEAASLDVTEVNVETRFAHYGPGESHGIPYRCLTPAGLRNVLVAGRSISCERIVHGSIRVMPVCLAMGEAAGMAAALAGERFDSDVHAVDTEALRDRLRSEGVYLPLPGPRPQKEPEPVLAR
ncbi:FAD dependent oxidoreductase [Verrucomicrobium sp. GAS474]|uniref:FAD-dependent oxidoreductase n=1 Tax=Verrucomicrobium sp. GAS474 TaxID=1882831 RepID=UPI00087C5689|nr:FAD-dependent oxidoreductase [Verrucomicrobium sp. GAS474]SDT91618.1 FAD dependent oxidoreductase [Verrucomicrobium sp. GAS474]